MIMFLPSKSGQCMKFSLRLILIICRIHNWYTHQLMRLLLLLLSIAPPHIF